MQAAEVPTMRSQNDGVTLQCGFDVRSMLRRSNSDVMTCWSWSGTIPSCLLSPLSTESNSSSDIAFTSETERLTDFISGTFGKSMRGIGISNMEVLTFHLTGRPERGEACGIRHKRAPRRTVRVEVIVMCYFHWYYLFEETAPAKLKLAHPL